MDFRVDDETQALLERYRAFVQDRLYPRERALLQQPFSASEPELQALRVAARAEGLYAPQVPAELGGLGLSLLRFGLVSEVLGSTPFGHYVFGCQAPDAGNIEILHKYGTPEQQERWLHPLLRGEHRSCFSMTEPDNPGSNPTELSCTARFEGDSIVLDGRKWFTSSAEGARFAIVMAVTHPDEARHLRASMIIVPTDTPGFRLVRNLPICGHPGDGYASHAEIAYEDCRVPRENLLGGAGTGFLIAQDRLGPGRIHHCMRWLGICARAYSLMAERLATRSIGEGRTLGDEPLAQATLAECKARIEAARLFVLQTAFRIDHAAHEGRQTNVQHSGPASAGPSPFARVRAEVSMIKFATSDVLMHVVDRAIQMYGGAGLTDLTPLSYWWAHERGARIYDGPDEVHKLAAGRLLLRQVRGAARN